MSGTCGDKLSSAGKSIQDEFALGDRDAIKSAQHFCKIGSGCTSELVKGIRQIPMLDTVVPVGFELLLDSACEVINIDPEINQGDLLTVILGAGGTLDKLPLLLRVIGDLTKSFNELDYVISEKCHQKFVKMEQHPDAGKDNTWDRLIPCQAGKECMDELIVSIAHIPVIGEHIQTFTADYASLIDLLTSSPCTTSAPTGPPSIGGASNIDVNTQNQNKRGPGKTDDSMDDTVLLGAGLGGAFFVALVVASVMLFMQRRRKRGLASAKGQTYTQTPNMNADIKSNPSSLSTNSFGNTTARPGPPPKPQYYTQNPLSARRWSRTEP
jgi:hypothetical protein